jgi:hypothetical protein
VGERVGVISAVAVVVGEGGMVGVADGLNVIFSDGFSVGGGIKLQAEKRIRTRIKKSFRIIQWLLFGFLQRLLYLYNFE